MEFELAVLRLNHFILRDVYDIFRSLIRFTSRALVQYLKEPMHGNRSGGIPHGGWGEGG